MAETLEAVTPADLDLLVRHRRGMWEAMAFLAPGGDDPSEEAYRAWLGPKLASGEVVGWVVREAGTAVASGLVWAQRWHPRPHIPRGTIPYLMSVFVEPAHRRTGIARRIAQAAIGWTQAAGHPRLALHASDAGRAVYEALGFKAGPEMLLDVVPQVDRQETSAN